MFPPLSVDELRARIDVSDVNVPDATLEEVLDTVRAMVDPRVDQARFPRANAAYLEGCYQLGVKVWQTRNAGLVAADPIGGFDFGATATSGLYKSVLGVLAPCLRHGGAVVA
jgi:hypothetical protein